MLNPSWNQKDRKYARRMMRCHNIQGFQLSLRISSFFNEPRVLNMFYSLGFYRGGIPINDAEYLEVKKSDFNEKHTSLLEGIDFVIDIDSGGFEYIDLAYESACNISQYLIKKGYPIEIRFSGRGFHILVPYHFFEQQLGRENISFDPQDNKCLLRHYYLLAKYLHDNLSEMIDLGIYDSRRVIKLPYSLVFYKTSDDTILKVMVAYPFKTIEEFKYFKLEDYELTNFLKNRPNFLDDLK